MTGRNPFDGEDRVSANFTVSPDFGIPNQPITFTNLSKNNKLYERIIYKWDFGDGNVSTDENPIHVYGRAGNYSVGLFITGAETLTTDLKWVSVPINEFISKSDIPIFEIEDITASQSVSEDELVTAIAHIKNVGTVAGVATVAFYWEDGKYLDVTRSTGVIDVNSTLSTPQFAGHPPGVGIYTLCAKLV